MTSGLSAAVLCGGQSTRMGFNKALADLLGKPLILHVCEGLSGVVDELMVIIGFWDDPALYRHLLPPHVKIFRDVLPSRTPICGMYSAFMNARNDYVYIHTCDSPFISQGVILELMGRAWPLEAVVPYWPERRLLEPLHAVYLAPALLWEMGEEKDLSNLPPRKLLRRLRRVHYLAVDELRRHDPDLLSFLNINYPSDLEHARELAKKHSSLIKAGG